MGIVVLKKIGGRGLGGRETNERPGTDNVTSGQMRGLEKNCTRWCRQTDKQTDKQTDGHRDSMNETSRWDRFSKKKCDI